MDVDENPAVDRLPSAVVEGLSPELPSSVDANVEGLSPKLPPSVDADVGNDATSSLVDKSPLVDDFDVLSLKLCFSCSNILEIKHTVTIVLNNIIVQLLFL